MAQFAITGLAALALLALVAVQLLRHLGTTEAIRDSKQVTQLAGRGIVAPYITPDLLAGKPSAVRRLDRIVRTRVLGGSVVRVKIWDARGRIVYSDDHRLLGSTYSLGKDEMEAMHDRGTDAEVSDLSRPENRFERQYKKLLEVYLGMKATNGAPVLFEIYEKFSSVAANGHRLFKTFLPALIAAMVLLELAQIPLAWSLARRLQRGQREREELLRRAIAASELERSRIARDLHDGPVQDLAGVSYTLAAASDELRESGSSPLAETLDGVARQARNSIRALRTLLVDIYPAGLHSEGLCAALSDLLAPLTEEGIETRLDADANLRVPREAEAVLFRAAQESLRNVRRHAEAQSVAVRLFSPDGHVVLEVEDDGRGFPAGTGTDPNGHFGLRMLNDLARDADGRLTIDSSPGEGTRVRIEVPVE